jgi:hypothetical protein
MTTPFRCQGRATQHEISLLSFYSANLCILCGENNDSFMSEPQILTAIIAVIFVAAFARSAVGFGDGAIAMPLLLLFVPLKEAAPLVGLVGLTLSCIILAMDWKHVDFAAAKWLIAATAVGVPLGLWWQTAGPESFTKIALGVLLICYGIRQLTDEWIVPFLENMLGLTLITGLLAGVVGGAYTIPGVPVAVYGHVRRWPPLQFRATMQGFFTPTYVVIIGGYASQGMITADVLTQFGWTLPAILVGLALGNWVNPRVPVATFRIVVRYALAVLGLLLVVQSWPD